MLVNLTFLNLGLGHNILNYGEWWTKEQESVSDRCSLFKMRCGWEVEPVLFLELPLCIFVNYYGGVG